jgi:hypothetical protein
MLFVTSLDEVFETGGHVFPGGADEGTGSDADRLEDSGSKWRYAVTTIDAMGLALPGFLFSFLVIDSRSGAMSVDET